jgi:EF-P beta-lysylation protein EpmB
MIPARPSPRQPAPAEPTAHPTTDWRRQLADGYRDPATLLSDLGLDPAELPLSTDATRAFPTRVPRAYARRMRPGDPNDPLLRQVLPVQAEMEDVAGYVSDPVGDMSSRQGGGVLKKYRGRALLITTGACAIHCRYCFRRHFPYAEEHAGRGRWQQALDAVAGDGDIREVILSGGDPLSQDNERLKPLVEGLGEIDHVKRLRIHTRLPVVLPDRVDPGLTGLLAAFPGPVTVVVHANHANELGSDVAGALQRLRGNGMMLFNQAVLLRGVNDTVASQYALSDRLTALGVAPYYLHQLDPVQGAAHFQVGDAAAVKLVEDLRRQAPGYMVPRLVREVEGDDAKRPISPETLENGG